MSTWHAPADDPRRWRLWPRRDRPGLLVRLVRIDRVEREEPVYVFEAVEGRRKQTFYASEGRFVPEGGGE